MTVQDIIKHLEELAPLSSQESYDNSGLIVGEYGQEVNNALISLDCTEEIVQEAIEKDCNLIISHHPIVFKGLKKLTGKNYVERTIIKAIQNNIAIYAIHTNLDNFKLGVNKKIGDLLGVSNPQILAPVQGKLLKLVVYVPLDKMEVVRTALFTAGAGEIGNYSECSFHGEGTGTYKGNEDSNPAYGKKNERNYEPEGRLEVLVSTHQTKHVVNAMLNAHPYEEVAYDLIPLLNENKFEGAGMIGELDKEMDEMSFLALLKETFKTGCIRHTNLLNKPIKKVAWCGGSGSFLLSNAKAKKADIFITGDFKYHEFFDAENQLVVADIGHFESEQFTIELIADLIRKKIPTFAPYLTEQNTNPVNYF
ncbi:MAG: Nif3-like dinuclear metal center hexameric protein [Crocinitomicaceae bacterium]|nr:Nif3-like dinuclear metal center hexameric protein [Crocinitomicaceae bacterium]